MADKKLKKAFALINKLTKHQRPNPVVKAIECEGGVVIDDEQKMHKFLFDYFRRNFHDANLELSTLRHDRVDSNLFRDADIDEAIGQTDFKEAIGEDWLSGELLRNEIVGQNLRT